MSVVGEAVYCGSYKVGAVVRRTVASTVYEATGAQAVIKTKEEDIEALAQRWREDMKLEHPNLLSIFDAGTCRMEGREVAYVVMEKADVSLAGVLKDRPLSRDEIEQMLKPTLGALEYLHKNGYTHGSIKPANVLAIGDKLKLSSDTVERSNAQAEDMRALGVLIVEALTQSKPEHVDPNEYGLNNSKDKLAEVVRRCLDANSQTRWTIDQVQAKLKPPAPAAPPAPTVIEIPSARLAEWRAETAAAASKRAPVEEEDRDTSPGMPKWIFAGLAALVLIVVFFALVRKNQPSSVAAAPIATAPTRTSPVVKELSSVQEAPPAVTQPPIVEKPSPLGTAAHRAQGWSVITAAYGNREAAEKRAHEMESRFPKFNISVVDQNTDRARFLVVLGQNLSENEADSLRQRAVRSGLPHDTYIKRATAR
jgi:eukaryotic-like serine/threonine-protein kinase